MSAVGAVGARARNLADLAIKDVVVLSHGKTNPARNRELVPMPLKTRAPVTRIPVQLIASLAVGKVGAGALSNAVAANKLELVTF
jgi:hypothetical protein